MAFCVGTLIIVGTVLVQIVQQTVFKVWAYVLHYVGWVGEGLSAADWFNLQQVIGDVSSWLSKEESAEEGSRNGGIWVPFLKGDGI